MAAYSKSAVKDKLLLEPGEKDEPAAGLFVPVKPGLTKEAELLNGRIGKALHRLRLDTPLYSPSLHDQTLDFSLDDD